MTLSPIEVSLIEQQVTDQMKTVYDPEIPVDIYELGLIYRVSCDDRGIVDIDMTLTAPGCPVAGTMPLEVEDKARQVAGVADVTVNLVWEPPWTMDNMSDEAKLELGLM